MTELEKYLPLTAKAAASDVGGALASQLDYAELLPAVDVTDGLSRVMNNKKLYFRLLRTFSGRKSADDIIAAVQNNNFGQVQQTAHSLKGVAANLGLNGLRSIALEIETRAKNNQAADDLLPALEDAVAATDAALARLLSSEAE